MRIEDYGLIGDLQTAALVGRRRLDRLALLPPLRLRRLLRRPARRRAERPLEARSRLAGSSGSSAATASARSSTSSTSTPRRGAVRVIDFMPPRGDRSRRRPDRRGARGQRADADGARAPLRLRRRSCRGCAGSTDDTRIAVAGPDAIALRTPVPLRGENMTHRRRVHGRARASASRSCSRGFRRTSIHRARSTPEHALDDTCSFWSEWLHSCSLRRAAMPRPSSAR